MATEFHDCLHEGVCFSWPVASHVFLVWTAWGAKGKPVRPGVGSGPGADVSGQIYGKMRKM